MAATYQQIPLMHLLAGETSGSIDDRVRAAVSQLAHYHVNPFWMGCPSVDLAKRALEQPPVTTEELGGVGRPIDLSGPFIVLLQHPTSDGALRADLEMSVTVEALLGIAAPVIALWPGEEAGADRSAKVLRRLHDMRTSAAWHFVRNLPPERFYRLLSQCRCLVGNSSVGIRECAFLGTPVVNIGDRQRRRRRAANVQDVAFEAEAIRAAIRRQMGTHYDSSLLYGDGTAGKRIAAWIRQIVEVGRL